MVLLESQTWISESVKYNWVDEVASYCDNNLSAFSTQLSATVGIAYALCGLFAVVYVANIVWKSWIDGGQIDLYRCFKPIVIGMFILNFNLVVGFIDLVTGAFNKGARAFNQVQTERSAAENASAYAYVSTIGFVGLEDKYEDERQSNNKDKGEETESEESDTSILSAIDTGISKMTDLIQSPAHFVELFVADLLSCIVAFITSIVCCVVLLTGFIGRCILTFFGPFVFCLSLIKGFDNTIPQWCRKYITYSLYPIIMNVVNGVLMGLSTMFMSSMKGNIDGVESIVLWKVVMCIIGICMMANVGKMAGSVMDIVQSGADAGMTAATGFLMKQGNDAKSAVMGKMGNSEAGSAATSAATGGVSLAAEAAAGMAKKTADTMSKGASDSNYKGGGK